MPYSNIRDFILEVDRIDELRTVREAGASELGAIAALARMMPGCPAVLFDDIKGYPKGFRVFANNISSPRRTALALGLDPSLPPIEVLRLWKERRKRVADLPTQPVGSAAFEENILNEKQLDILRFPIPKWHEGDGGPYLGSGCVSVMRDPEEDWVNLGIYRLQAHDGRRLTIHFDNERRHGYLIAKKYWQKNKNCPVAVACGEDPALFIAASESAAWGVSEYGYAGWIRGEPFKVLTSGATGLPLPANSEIIIEGEIPPPEQESLVEGPFGEATGYYTGEPRPSPVIRIKRIMHRNGPILCGNAPLRPPYHTAGIPLDAARLWSDLERAGVKNVVGVWKPSRWVAVISLHQSSADDCKRAGEIAVRSAGVYLDRVIAIVDEDIDPTDAQDLLWAVSTRCEPASGVTVYPNLPGSTLDPLVSPERAARGDFTHSKMVINACKPFQWKDRFPVTNAMTSETRKVVSERWLEHLKSQRDSESQAK